MASKRFFSPRLKFRNYERLNASLLDRCLASAKAQADPEHKEWQLGSASTSAARPAAGRSHPGSRPDSPTPVHGEVSNAARGELRSIGADADSLFHFLVRL